MAQLLQDITRLQDALGQYEQLDKQRAQARVAREALGEKTAALERARTQAQAAEQTCKDARAQLAEQPKLAVAAGQTAQEQKAAEQRCKALTELDRQCGRRAELQEKLADAQAEYTRAAEAAQAAAAHYSALDRAYLDAQAGILARTLTPGQPCPVCGATEHPCPAAAPEQTPDAAARKRAKADSERAQRDSEACSAKAAALRGQLTAVCEALETACAALTPPLDPETLAETLPALQEKAAQDARGCAGRLAKQEEQLAELQALADGLSEQEAALQQQRDAIRAGETDCAARAARCDELDAAADSRAAELPHADSAAAKAALAQAQAQHETLRQALDTAQKQHAAAQAKCAQLSGKVTALREQADAAPPADTAALQERRDTLSARIDALQAQINALDARLQQNRAARVRLDAQRQEYDAAHERWQWVHALAATANGTIPGQEKITLEAFLQAAYFDRILGRANTRLLIMSGGQYELRRCERAGDNRSQTGLELEVVDHYNGTARSVKTLSGGETFAASLSLALGLSDEVQSSAGGVQLEAMFVDEGFGSLDSEALQQALTALVGVSGGCRIVGIISHVAELKERIDRQIIVTKDRSGGSRVRVQA